MCVGRYDPCCLFFCCGMIRFPVNGHEAVVTDEAKRMLSRTKELCYLTSFVIRLFEDAEKVHVNNDKVPVVATAAGVMTVAMIVVETAAVVLRLQKRSGRGLHFVLDARMRQRTTTTI